MNPESALHAAPAIAEIVRRIVDISDPERVILFGSHARGNASPDSDVDLLIVESEPFGPKRSRRREMARLWKALADLDAAKDLLVFSREEVERWQGSRNHVIGRALREGIVLYERAG